MRFPLRFRRVTTSDGHCSLRRNHRDIAASWRPRRLAAVLLAQEQLSRERGRTVRDWRLVCPLSRLPVGGSVTALLGGAQVRVRRAQDGTVQAGSTQPGELLEHDVRVQHGIVEVALPGSRVMPRLEDAVRPQPDSSSADAQLCGGRDDRLVATGRPVPQ